MSYFFYIVRCKDNSLYCGITTEVDRRLAEHNSNTTKAAKYTRSRFPVNLVYKEIYETKNLALKREYAVKKLTKYEKEKIIENYKNNV